MYVRSECPTSVLQWRPAQNWGLRIKSLDWPWQSEGTHRQVHSWCDGSCWPWHHMARSIPGRHPPLHTNTMEHSQWDQLLKATSLAKQDRVVWMTWVGENMTLKVESHTALMGVAFVVSWIIFVESSFFFLQSVNIYNFVSVAMLSNQGHS